MVAACLWPDMRPLGLLAFYRTPRFERATSDGGITSGLPVIRPDSSDEREKQYPKLICKYLPTSGYRSKPPRTEDC
jgi:hypothetical protein